MSDDRICIQFPFATFQDKLKTIAHNADIGYIYLVDLHYPNHLHDEHSDYPLAPESLIIDETMYSPFMKEYFPATNGRKLTPNLGDKKEYTVHYRNLQLYLDMGMVVTKIHRVLEFKQSPWLKPYIDLNTTLRTDAVSDFEKSFFKLMNNAVFGKSMENVRKRISVELITDERVFMKRVAKPTFERGQIIGEDLATIQCFNTSVTLNRPIYCGFAILDISKILMYNFHYNYMKKKYPGNKLKL